MLEFKEWRLNEKKMKKESCMMTYTKKDGMKESIEVSYNEQGASIKCVEDITQMFESQEKYQSFKEMIDTGCSQAEMLQFLQKNTVGGYSWAYGTDNDSGDGGE